MASRKRKALGRGMADLLDGSFSSIVEPAPVSDDLRHAEEAVAAPAALMSAPRAPARHAEVQAPAPRATTAPMAPPAIPATPPARRAAASNMAEGAGAGTLRPFDVISISSGKGGTGKSVVASNLGVLLAGQTRVTILDADLGLANIHILYNLMPAYNVSHVIAGGKALDEIVLRGPHGVSVIPGGSGIPELASLTGEMFGMLVKEIATLDRFTDLLLIDTPGGIDKQSLMFLLASDQVLVVTTGDITALTDAYAIIKTVLAHKPSAAVVLVVNQARSQTEGMESFHKVAHVVRKFLGRELALGGVIPFDENVERSVAERTPVVLSHPDSAASRAMAALAVRVGAFHGRSPRAGMPFSIRLQGLLAGATLRGA